MVMAMVLPSFQVTNKVHTNILLRKRVGRMHAYILGTRKIAIDCRVIRNSSGRDSDSGDENGSVYAEMMPPEGLGVLMSCAVGVLTGLGVVAFNYAVHEIHDVAWQGVPRVTWFRLQPLSKTWEQIVLVPVGGGVAVGMISVLQSQLERLSSSPVWFRVQAILKPFLKTVAAAVTLGTANSLGPEGPSVEIGASVGNGVGATFRNSQERRLSLVAAGSAAGISSGFNAAVSGCFFAVESVLKSAPPQSAASVTTAMVLLSSVLATVVSQAGLGSDPAFKIPAYDFRSPSELPLYLLLGIICGGLSISLTKGSAYATTLFDKFQKATGISPAFLPPLGGFCVGLIALAYPEVLYWGFENFDSVLESRPWAKGAPAGLLLQVVGAKVVATSLCRGSRLVGGVYAPSLFIGACFGSAYGKLVGYVISHADPIYHLDTLNVAAPQAYALVGMAAMLAGVCQVPFTAVLLLFELTRDYRIILPLMAGVGLSSWVASSFGTKLKDSSEESKESSAKDTVNDAEEVCRLDESLCVTRNVDESILLKELTVSTAMKKNYLTVSPDDSVQIALALILKEKEWCVLVAEKESYLRGILTLGDIQEKVQKSSSTQVSQMRVSEMSKGEVITAKPNMTLDKASRLMANRGLRQLPVLSHDGLLVGLIDQEAIRLACRVEATRRLLRLTASR